ncbi:type VI secretion system lipoprotein TssJ [Achromobacter spanius]|uniref:Type VI secretion system lipoprotein TssJ n=1 Tax=Achromobacter spanius TaxID=217203 RepID=A0A2S0IE78_9BURK|nr:type VI secretion system lipoprotein TssJ [Achromobacter spanius]AVJ30268.1 type VI secretion system lipoprotein TssJ [Achromobacter spanius]
MRPAVGLLCIAALLSGCTTVGNVLTKTGQVLMDPGIQVGPPEDQPTQVALSLYATKDVNPNPVAEPAVDLAPAALDERSFSVNVHGESREDLVHSLQTLLDHLHQEASAAAASEDGTSTLVRSGFTKVFKPRSVAVSPALDRLWADTVTTSRVPFPVQWQLRQGDDAQKSTAATGEVAGGYDVDVALGQYRDGVPLAPAAALAAADHVNATPIAFRVIQLKDDSLLENADPDLVRNAPKKALGSTYIKADDYMLAPGQFKFINYHELDEDTHYVAVVAAFNAPDAQRWYDVLRVEPRSRKYALLVTLQDTRVAITDENYRPERAAPRARNQARKNP